jgi:hypothetical protein
MPVINHTQMGLTYVVKKKLNRFGWPFSSRNRHRFDATVVEIRKQKAVGTFECQCGDESAWQGLERRHVA